LVPASGTAVGSARTSRTLNLQTLCKTREIRKAKCAADAWVVESRERRCCCRALCTSRYTTLPILGSGTNGQSILFVCRQKAVAASRSCPKQQLPCSSSNSSSKFHSSTSPCRCNGSEAAEPSREPRHAPPFRSGCCEHSRPLSVLNLLQHKQQKWQGSTMATTGTW
jgi:hypothetical protein